LGGILGAVIVYALFGPVIDHVTTRVISLSRARRRAGVFFHASGAWPSTAMHASPMKSLTSPVLVVGIDRDHRAVQRNVPRPTPGAPMIGFPVAILGSVDWGTWKPGDEPGCDLGQRLFAYFAGWVLRRCLRPTTHWWISRGRPALGGVIAAYLSLADPRPSLPALRARVAGGHEKPRFREQGQRT